MPSLLLLLPLAITTVPPLRQILLTDRLPAKTITNPVLHLRQRIQPCHQLLALVPCIQPLIQFLPHLYREPRNLSVTSHSRYFLIFSFWFYDHQPPTMTQSPAALTALMALSA